MKKNEVKIGKTYRCKVTGKLADVRITGENAHGGWDAVNVVTNRKVHIKSAQRLRGPAQHPPAGKRKRIVSLAEHEAKAKAEADIAKGKEDAPKAAKGRKAAAKRDLPTGQAGTGERRAKGAKPVSGLDAAAQVLAEAGEPLNTKTMVERMLAQGLWKTGGKTPAGTIHAAIIREIAAKGSEARFKKVERGKFEAVK